MIACKCVTAIEIRIKIPLCVVVGIELLFSIALLILNSLIFCPRMNGMTHGKLCTCYKNSSSGCMNVVQPELMVAVYMPALRN